MQRRSCSDLSQGGTLMTTEKIRQHFLSPPSLELIEAIRSKNKDRTLEVFESNPTLSAASGHLLHRASPSHLSLHLIGSFKLPNTRYITIVRAISYETTVPALEHTIYQQFALRFAHVYDAMNLWRELRKSPITKKLGLNLGLYGVSSLLFFPETSVGNPTWLCLDLREQKLEPVRMDGLNDGFSDQLYLMSCVGEFEDFAPNTHWMSKLRLPPHIITADFHDL